MTMTAQTQSTVFAEAKEAVIAQKKIRDGEVEGMIFSIEDDLMVLMRWNLISFGEMDQLKATLNA